MPKKKKKEKKGLDEWMGTYGDMVTLLLVFFVILANPKVQEGITARLLQASLQGLGVIEGGRTISKDILVEGGHNFRSFQSPTQQQTDSLSQVQQVFESTLKSEIENGSVQVQLDERGLVVSLAADSFFPIASARLRIEQARETLQKLAVLLQGNATATNPIKIEGHTDREGTDPNGPWPTNWELSTARASNVLHYLSSLGVPESRFEVSGFASNRPIANDDTPEGTALNRRVDVVILSEGNL